MDMHRRRPADPDGRPRDEVLPVPQRAHGFCYLVPQGALYFGSDRKQATDWRPAVSLIADGGRRYLLPSTTQPSRAYYRLERERCFHKRPAGDARTAYLCPRVELLPVSALVEIGLLPHAECLAITAWLRARQPERPQ